VQHTADPSLRFILNLNCAYISLNLCKEVTKRTLQTLLDFTGLLSPSQHRTVCIAARKAAIRLSAAAGRIQSFASPMHDAVVIVLHVENGSGNAEWTTRIRSQSPST
jgi:hypothetical protein